MPTQTFWTAEDKIPISQKKVSVQAENGLQYSLGQQIDFVIPESVGYIQPSETYLRMDVKIQNNLDVNGNKTRLFLDAETGCNVLIKDIRISSGGAQNILLEELQNVNVLTALKYDYENNDTLQKKRGLTEGTVIPTPPEQRGTLGCTSSATTNLSSNPYYTNSVNFDNDNFETVKALLRLPTGIFQNDKIFPLGLTGGLRIQIMLEEAGKVVRTQDSVKNFVNQRCNPYWHSTNGSNTSPWNLANGDSQTQLFLQRANSVTSVDNCPFVIGETISFYSPTSGTDAGTDFAPVITNIEYVYSAGIGGEDASSGLVKLSFASTQNNTGSEINANYIAYSRSSLASTFAPTVSVDNVELICQKVTMPEGYTRKLSSMLKAGGSMNYDFLSYTNYKYSQQMSDRVANIRLPLGESRCKSILCVPTDSMVYTTPDAINASATYIYNELEDDCGAAGKNKSQRSGLVGIADHATNYQFIYDGKLNPNRKVPLSRISVVSDYGPLNQQCLIEQEKALHQAGIDPLSFEAYQRNFFIGRALSLQNGIYDARGKDFNLQVEYNETTAPTKPKLWNCWVAHLRRIVVRGENIALEV
jgi:hypothetical protein